MEINRENYEAYFIDYLEGNLDELLVNDFIEFLQNNPDLKEELSLFESVSVKPEEIPFDKKEKLYKEKLDSEKEFNKAAIANLEGDISVLEKSELDAHLLKHPAKNKDIALFSATKLQPDESITFNKKNRLYQHSIGKTVLLWSGRVAAILLVLVTFYLFIDKPVNDLIPVDKIAKLEDKKEKNTETAIPVNKTPVDSKKKDPVKTKNVITKPPVKKVPPKQIQRKSLRESTKGRVTHEDLVLNRMPIEIPEKLNSITASLNIQKDEMDLAMMYITLPPDVVNYGDERLLADVVKEKTGLNNFKFNKITKAGLNLVSNISKKKFKYETDQEGKVTEYNYDSRLFAFSIPSKNSESTSEADSE